MDSKPSPWTAWYSEWVLANLRFHMLFLYGIYIGGVDGSPVRFRWVKAPTSAELTALAHTIARRVGRFLERQGCWSGMRRIAIWPQIAPMRAHPALLRQGFIETSGKRPFK